MATKWDLAGAHALRRYIWQLLQDELGWSTDNYGGLNPIITPQQEPELNEFNAPYIVYVFSKRPAGSLWLMEKEDMSISIFSVSDTEINQVVNLLSTKLAKHDEAAQDVNAFIRGTMPAGSFYKNFDFKSIVVTGAQGSNASVTEGGRKDGYVTLSYTYTLYESDPNSPDYGESIRI